MSLYPKTFLKRKKLIHIHAHLDLSKELVPVTPATHYSMGGIDVDEDLQTSIKGLYALGECSNVKVHGANRLGGNSLLELVYFGKLAAKNMKKISLHVDMKNMKKQPKRR